MSHMPTIQPIASPWTSRLLTLCLGGLVAASVVAWTLKVQGLQSTPSIAPIAMVPTAYPELTHVAKALGAVAKPTADVPVPAPILASSRFVLVGVVAIGAQGAALIAVDGKPAKPYSVGATVGDTFVLQSVQARQAVLGSGAADSAPAGGQVMLTMPAIEDKRDL
jgi:general secretion pathway protein C